MSEVLTWARRWARRPNAADHELLEVPAATTLDAVRTAYHKLARFAHPDLHRSKLTPDQLEEVTATFARVSHAYATLSARLRGEGGTLRGTAKSHGAAQSQGAGQSQGVARSQGAGQATSTAPAAISPRAPAAPTASPLRAAAPTASPLRAAAPTVPAPPAGPTASPLRAAAPTAPAPPAAQPPAATTPSPSASRAPAITRATASATGRSLPIGPANAMSPRALGHYRRAELAMLRGNDTEAMLHLRMALASDPQSSFLRSVLTQLEAP